MLRIIKETSIRFLKDKKQQEQNEKMMVAQLGQQLVQEKLKNADLKNQVNSLGKELVKIKLGG